MPEDDIQRWVDEKLKKNIDEDILRDVLEEKGYSNVEIERLLDKSEYSSGADNESSFGLEKQTKNYFNGFEIKNPGHIGFAFLGITIAISFLIFFTNNGYTGQCGEEFRLNEIDMTEKELYLDYEVKSDTEQTFGLATILKSGEDNMVLDKFSENKANSTWNSYETRFNTSYIPKSSFKYSTVSLNFNECGEAYKIIMDHDKIGETNTEDVRICRSKCRGT